MARPRIEGRDERIIASFLSRGIYSSHKEVISEALRALVRQQLHREAIARSDDPLYSDEFYMSQINPPEEMEKHEDAPMGNLVRKTAAG